ncbi:MAG: adenosine kinase [Alphaproteobacteria bacterium]|nr:adenosine kinase [Alphaproteobacteria bacterium]
MKKTLDIVAVGAPAVDLQFFADDAFLAQQGLKKGQSTATTTQHIADALKGHDVVKTPGGACTNVVTGIALHSGRAAMIGKIANDENGVWLAQKMKEAHVQFEAAVTTSDSATACIAVITTPDAERSFLYVGQVAGYELAPEDIDETTIARARYTYIDSFLSFSDSGRQAAQHAADVAKRHNSKVAVSLNSKGHINDNPQHFQTLAQKADILLGDQKEFMTLFKTDSMDTVYEELHKLGCMAAITAGAAGSHIVHAGKVTHIPAQKVKNVVDTSGAGDQYAAGVLFGLARRATLEKSAAQGAAWAAHIVQHAGAAPRDTLKPAKAPPKPKLG